MLYENSIENIIKAQNGDEVAMSQMNENNIGLIWRVVKRFKDRGYELEDLYQIGAIGFIKSVKKFDMNYEVKLSTYAVPYIIGEIKRFMRDDGSIKVSRGLKELAVKIREIQEKYMRERGKEITITEIAKELKTSKEEVAAALDSLNPMISIYDKVYSDEEGGIGYIDKISNGIDESEQITNRVSIKSIIDNLEEREREIILLRYYKNKTQMEVAKILGISQVQVSRIEKRVLSSMKMKLAI